MYEAISDIIFVAIAEIKSHPIKYVVGETSITNTNNHFKWVIEWLYSLKIAEKSLL